MAPIIPSWIIILELGIFIIFVISLVVILAFLGVRWIKRIELENHLTERMTFVTNHKEISKES